MSLEWVLESPKVWAVAGLAGGAGMLIDGKGTRWWAFVRYALLAFAVKLAMPSSFNKIEQPYVYVVYGLVLGAIIGALPMRAKSARSKARPPGEEADVTQRTSMRDRLAGAGKGAALGLIVNIVIGLWTYV